MLLAKGVAGLCLTFFAQHSFAETNEPVDDELDQEFIEILGSIDDDDEDWFEYFLTTIDEAEEEQLTETDYE